MSSRTRPRCKVSQWAAVIPSPPPPVGFRGCRLFRGGICCFLDPPRAAAADGKPGVRVGWRLEAPWPSGNVSHPCLLLLREEVTANLIPSGKQLWTCQLLWQPLKVCVTFSARGSSWGSLWTKVTEFSQETGQLALPRASGYPPGTFPGTPGRVGAGQGPTGWPFCTPQISQCPDQGGMPLQDRLSRTGCAGCRLCSGRFRGCWDPAFPWAVVRQPFELGACLRQVSL